MKNPRLENAIEQLRWQFGNDPNQKAPGGAAFAVARDDSGLPVDVIFYAWGDGALVIYEVLRANGLAEQGPDCRTFPPKPSQN